jgi:hypothetical protein
MRVTADENREAGTLGIGGAYRENVLQFLLNRSDTDSVTGVERARPRAEREDRTGMADLKVDYQLLASIHATMTGLTAEFDTIEDQASAYSTAYGYDGITSAMSGFSGNWADHRKKLLGTMQNLDRMVTATSQDFHHTDNELAADLGKASASGKRR